MSPFFPEPPLHDFPDRAIRHLLTYPAHLEQVAMEVAPDAASLLDFPRTAVLRRDLPMPDWRRRETDLLFRVPFRDPGPVPASVVCLLVEHASQPDQRTPLRSLLYAVLYWEREWQAWEELHEPRSPLRLSPVLPIVFATGARPWRAPRSFVELFGDPGLFQPFIPSWQPLLWEVATRTPEQLLGTAGEWLQAMAVVRAEDDEPERFQQVLAEVMRRLEPIHQNESVRWHDLMWFLLSWAIRRRPGSERDNIVAAMTANVNDAAIQQEVRTMAGRVGQRWEDEVLARGMARGEELGRLAARREDLRLLLEGRFGPLPEDLVQRIEAVKDADRLLNCIAQLGAINQLSELQL
jgi:hypothetical protein